MRIDIVTLFPGMIEAATGYGVTGRAVEHGILQLGFWNPRDFTRDRHRTVDDRPFGGGPGMVMMLPPLRDAIRAARTAQGPGSRVIYLSPQGERLDQRWARATVADDRPLVLVAGRYEGVDERLLATEVDEELSIGDYVCSGGEPAAVVVIDVLARLLPGALGDESSAEQDSFMDGLLDHAQYTRPRDVDGLSVPDVLLSGNHRAIRRWRLKQALEKTWRKRPDMLSGQSLDRERQELLLELIRDLDQDVD